MTTAACPTCGRLVEVLAGGRLACHTRPDNPHGPACPGTPAPTEEARR
jgi:hypothetical protein